MRKEHFGKMPSGKDVDLFTLANKNGLEAKISNYGGIIVSIKAPDRQGRLGDIALGYDSLDRYLQDTFHFGGIIGRYANRIAKGKFGLNGKTYTLACNNGENHLHGGTRGFDKALWQGRELRTGDSESLELKYVSRDGEEGFPGNLRVQVIYSLTNESELRIDYAASTDADTVINLTNHSYFNLSGDASETILGHELFLDADGYLPVDASLTPTGVIERVAGTPFDFSKSATIGSRISADHLQLDYGKGYDHNWVLKNRAEGDMKLAAKVYEPKSGRTLEIHTTQPGIQFYSGNFLDGKNRGKANKVYTRRCGFCLETQHFPDSPNHPGFPSTILKPDEQFRSCTIHKFSVRS